MKINTALKSQETIFKVDEKDIAFYMKIGVPSPSLSPALRRMRRLSFRNESSIYKRKCDFSGKQIVSMYSADKPFIVYDNEFWWKDNWDSLDYGREFDFSRAFFPQFRELLLYVPKMARIQQGEQFNSQFTNCASFNKNCFLIFSSNRNEDCMYSKCINSSRGCIDCFACNNCELCYDTKHSDSCYNCRSISNCKNCIDCHYLENCIGCSNCFGCVNLRNKSFHIFNKALSKEQYFQKLAQLNLGSYKVQLKISNQFEQFSKAFDIPAIYGQQNENVSGNYLWNCKNSLECFYSCDLEDCRYCDDVSRLKDSYDVSFYGATGTNELLYECEGVGHNVSNIRFSKLIWGGCFDVSYSYECHACQHIFGCTGLRNSQFCILNKQYSEAQFYELRDKIIQHMKVNLEWGEFFPIELSPFAYNETVANEFFPLTKEQATTSGYKWRDPEELPALHCVDIADDIREVTSDIIGKQLTCRTSGKSYRIESSELDLYYKLNIPLPRQHYLERFKSRSSRPLMEEPNYRDCQKCSKSISTSNRGKVSCEDCFLEVLI